MLNRRRTLHCRLTSSLLHYINGVVSLLVLIFANTWVWIFRVDLFLQMKKILPQYTPKNLEPYFDFVLRGTCEKRKNLKNYEI